MPTHIAGLPMLRDSRIKLIEFARQTHHVVPEHGTKFEDILTEAYWSMVAYKLNPCDIIEIHAEDGSYYAQLYVRAAGKNWAKVSPIVFAQFDKSETKQGASEYEVAWKGPHRMFAVIRVADNEIIKDGFKAKELAEDYMKSHSKAMAA
jgi:hypothetical protein